jgi:hypothetical protein
MAERGELALAGADATCYEEIEVAVGLAKIVLRDRGADEAMVARESARIRTELAREIA